MKRQRKATRCLFSLALTASTIWGGLTPSGHSGSRFHVSALAGAPLLQAQEEGEGWQLVNNGLDNLTIAALAIDPVNPARIYAGTMGGGFFKSTDGGSSWSNVGLNARFGRALAINFANPNVVYAGTGERGVCRRNPDDPPDSHFAGFNFWLDKLDQFQGNYIEAEMVKAFLLSTEYRQRFGQL